MTAYRRDLRWLNLLAYDRRKTSSAFLVLLSLTCITFYWSALFGDERRTNTFIAPLPTSCRWAAMASNFIIKNKVAVIVENRQSENLIPLILHFSSVLGPEWPIVLFTSIHPNNLSDSAPWKRGIDKGQFAIRSLPTSIEFSNHKTVSSFLTKPWFWEQLAPADHVLFFQTDSIICANAPQHVDDYLQYDMIGAPIAYGMGQGYNGGLSLRNRNKMLQIVQKHDWEHAWELAEQRKANERQHAEYMKEKEAKEAAEKAQAEKDKEAEGEKTGEEDAKKEEPGAKRLLKRQETIGPMPHTYVFPDNPTPPWEDYEDQWFFKRLTELKKWNGRPGANLPGMNVSMTFSVETIPYEKPLGYHQVGMVGTKDFISQVEKWCPEYHLCETKRFEGAG